MTKSGDTGEVPDTELVTPAVIRLDIPSAVQYLATARVVAAAAGADAGLSVDDLDDLRLAVDELTALLIARAGSDARIELVIEVVPQRAVVVGRVIGEIDGSPDPTDELSARIVAAVSDAYSLDEREFRVEKSASARG